MIRTISEVIESFRIALTYTGSKLSNFSTYSNIYALYRSIASVITQHEKEVESLKDGFFISTSTAGELDRRAADFNLFRKQGTSSTGYLLVEKLSSNTQVEIPIGTILTNASTSIQLETLEKVSASAVGEQSIQVRSLSLSLDSNLPAGVSLYSSLYPSFKFIVGRYRNPLTSTIEGSLSGGRNTESDDEFRARVKNFLTSLSRGTSQALIQSILGVSSVSKVLIKENKPVTGYLTIYVDSNSIDVLRRVSSVVEQDKAAGVAYTVKSLKKVDLTIALEIELRRGINVESTVTSVRNAVFNYLDTLNVDTIATPESIAGTVLRVDGVINVRVLTPTSPVVLNDEEVINVSNILVSTIISR